MSVAEAMTEGPGGERASRQGGAPFLAVCDHCDVSRLLVRRTDLLGDQWCVKKSTP
jgi:hypothetical protein